MSQQGLNQEGVGILGRGMGEKDASGMGGTREETSWRAEQGEWAERNITERGMKGGGRGVVGMGSGTGQGRDIPRRVRWRGCGYREDGWKGHPEKEEVNQGHPGEENERQGGRNGL